MLLVTFWNFDQAIVSFVFPRHEQQRCAENVQHPPPAYLLLSLRNVNRVNDKIVLYFILLRFYLYVVTRFITIKPCFGPPHAINIGL